MVRFIYGLVVASLATTLVSSASPSSRPSGPSSLGVDLSCYTRDYTPVCCTTSGENERQKKRTYAKKCQAPKSIQDTCEIGRCITGCKDFHIKTKATCDGFVTLDGESNTCEWDGKRCGYPTADVVDFDETPNQLQVCRESYTTCWTTGLQTEDGCIGPLKTCVAAAWNIGDDDVTADDLHSPRRWDPDFSTHRIRSMVHGEWTDSRAMLKIGLFICKFLCWQVVVAHEMGLSHVMVFISLQCSLTFSFRGFGTFF